MRFLKYIALVGLLVFCVSCGSAKKVVYFQDADLVQKVETQAAFQAQIQPDDLLSIYVTCENMEAAEPFNTPMGVGFQGGQMMHQQGYLVDKDGYIDFPVFGAIKVGGLTRNQLSDSLKLKLNTQINNPIVSIKFLNFKVTVLGEVGGAGTFQINSERVTILDALAMAGDMGINAKRKNVLILREFGSEKVFARLDLTQSEFLTSPYFYLQQNDVIYVEPNKGRIFQSSSGTQVFSYALSIVSSLLSLGTAILVLFNVK